MKAGRAGTRTHDYKRHGTTALFAALNTLDGTVISMCEPRHRHEEWLKFLRLIDRKPAKHLTLHLIVDNYGTHAHPAVQAWLAKHPRFVMHFTPTGVVAEGRNQLPTHPYNKGASRSASAPFHRIAHHQDGASVGAALSSSTVVALMNSTLRVHLQFSRGSVKVDGVRNGLTDDRRLASRRAGGERLLWTEMAHRSGSRTAARS